MKKIVSIFFCLVFFLLSDAQKPTDPFIKLVQPLKEKNAVSASQQFIIGSTCTTCTIKINQDTVKVYPTGAFAYEINLKEKENTFLIESDNGSRKSKKTVSFTYTLPPVPQPVRDFSIEYIQTLPAGDLWLKPGDPILFRVKTLTHCEVKVNNKQLLFEMPDSLTKGMSGIYQGKYIIQPSDSFYKEKLMISVKLNDSAVLYRETSSRFTVMQPDSSDVVMTKGRLAHLEYGLGDDRLGGAKMGYIDSLIPLKIIGKVSGDYKVRLSKDRTAYIPEEHVSVMPPGYSASGSLTGKIRLTTDSTYDYVNLQLFSRLPYQAMQQTDPNRIVVDVFGATNNTNWIDQPEMVKEIKKVEYEQLSDEVYRMIITLNHQHWGYKIYYSGNNLVVRVKQQPHDLSLNKVTIALDAGHGGTNTGAVGATGITEKELTLQITNRVKQLLEVEGAKVIMTREKELFFDNKERILFYRDSTPDLLLSIHLNSANDPFRSSGTSTFYRYEGFRPLSRAIYKRMLELGLKEYGNNGSFNFMLNSPTEYPNALIETLFLSNLEEETKVLDPVFQEQMAEKIVQGVKDYLEGFNK